MRLLTESFPLVEPFRLSINNTADFKDKKVVLVAVPGAFTRTCSEKHIPTFVQHQDALKAKGVDKVVVIAYNGKP